MFEDLKRQANLLGLSLSAYIRDTLKKDLEERSQKPQIIDFSEFIGMWKDKDISQKNLRKQAWKQ